MREVLDRLREAETALDKQMSDLYYAQHTANRVRALTLLWEAKQSLWYASMHLFNAFAGPKPAGHGR